ncbi:MAG: hypothetical protein ACTSRI_06735 [Promethearchaeota archaeon]
MRKLEDLKSWKRVACLISVIGGLQFIIITIFAMIFYSGGYLFFEYTFSYLGTTCAVNGTDNTISRVLFVIACTTAAITLSPFWFVMPTLFFEKNLTKYISLLGSTCGVVSSPFLILLAIIPGDIDFAGHILATNIFFLLFAAAILIYSIVIFLNKDYQNIYGFVGIAFSILIVLYPAVFRSIDLIRALMQKIIIYGFILWVEYQVTKVWKVESLENRM